MNLEEHFMQ